MHLRPRFTLSFSLRLLLITCVIALAPCILQAQLSGAVGSVSTTQTAMVVITATGTSDATTPVYVLTQGAQNSDFKLISGGTCSANTSYSTLGAACTVKYTFTPSHPGPRYGGITLVTSTGALLGNTFISGTGTGPQASYTPVIQTSQSTGTQPEKGIAVDGRGDIYIMDASSGGGNPVLREVPAGCTDPSCIRLLSYAFTSNSATETSGLAVDGSGNLYIAEEGSQTNSVHEMLAVGGVIPDNATVINLGTGPYENPSHVWVDANGNVYIASYSGIQELKAVNGVIPASAVPKTLAGINDYTAMAVDTNGNVYYSTAYQGTISKISAADGSVSNLGGETIQSAAGMVFDQSGNLYVVDFFYTSVQEYLAVNGLLPATPTVVSLGSGLQQYTDIAVDPSGNVYVVIFSNSIIWKLNYGSIPSFTFPTATQDGSTDTADGTQSFQITNAGNATLTASGFGGLTTGDFVKVAGSGTPADCTSSFSLAVGASCNVSLSFQPVYPAGGAISDSFVFVDNDLNSGSSGTQTVDLSATAVAPQPTVTGLSATTGPSSGGTPVVITGTNLGGTSAVYFGTAPASSVAIVNSTQLSVVSPAYTGGSTVDVTVVSYAATSATSTADHFSYALTPDSITINGTIPSTIVWDSGTVSINASSTSGQQVSYTSTTSSVCYVSTSGVVQPLTVGSCSVTVSQAVSSSYTAAAPVTISFSITGATDTINFPAPANTAYSSTLIRTAATSTAGTAIQPITFTPNTPSTCTTTTDGLITMVAIGTCTITANQAAGGNYLAALPVPASFTILADIDTIAIGNSISSPQYLSNGTIGINASTTSGQTPSYASVTPAVCSVAADGTITLIATGTCTVNVSQAAAGNYAAATTVPVSFTVSLHPNTITIASSIPSPQYLGIGTIAINASSTSEQALNYMSATPGICSVATNGAITLLTAGFCTVNLSQAAAGNYAAATTMQVGFTVAPQPDTITVLSSISSPQYLGSGPIAINATSTSGQALTYTSATPAICSVASDGTITLTAPGTCTVYLSQPAAGNYATATIVPITFTASLVSDSITFPVFPNTPYVGPIPVLAATATSGQPVTYTSSTAATCSTTTNGTITFLAVGTCTITASQNAAGNYTAAIPVTQSFLITVGTLSIGTTSMTETASVTITTAGILNTINVLTQGATGLDFNVVTPAVPPVGACDTGTNYNVGDVCTVQFTFKPTQPFARFGGVSLSDASGNLLGNSFLAGTGTGPHAIYSTSVQSTLGSSFLNTAGMTIDASGNVYVADASSTSIQELVAVNGVLPANPAVRTLGSGFLNPTGVAVDGNGNVYVADSTNGAVKEIVAVNGIVPASPANATIVSIGGAIGSPSGVAVDGSGNVFVGATEDHAVKEIRSGCLTTSCVLTLGTVPNPQGVAVDASDNVYVAILGSDSIQKFVATNGVVTPGSTPMSMNSGINSAYGVAVDGFGNVYATDTANGALKEILASNGTVITVGTGFNQPVGIAVDTAGNIYEADNGGTAIKELSYAVAPVFNFATATTDGTTDTTDGPKSFQIVNNGNATLTAVAPGIGGLTSGSFTKVAGTGTPVDCTATLSVAAGASCNVSIAFTPAPATNGAVTDTVSVIDNSLHTTTTQTVNLSGSGVVAMPVVTGISPSTGSVLGGTVVTITGSGFTGTYFVSFGSKAATSFTFINDTTVTAVYPGQTSGPVDVQVYTAAGYVSATTPADLFTSIIPSSFAAGTETVGTKSAKQTAYITITTAGTLNNINYLTQGATGQDFNVATGGAVPVDACTTSTAYTVGQVCSVRYTFTPKHPWLRAGGVSLTDASGKLIGQTYLSGTGTGPQAIYNSNTITPLSMGGNITAAQGIAVDGSGNVYVTDSSDDLVKEVPATCTIATCVINLGSGWGYPDGVAVDGLGNVFVADYNLGVRELVAVNGAVPANATPVTLYSSTHGVYPTGLAVDASGNIFFSDGVNKNVDELSAGGTFQILAGGFGQPESVAVDGNGNVYVADLTAGSFYQVPAGGGSPTAIATGFSHPTGITVDGAGNVYVTDYNNDQIIKLLAVNGSLPASPVHTTVGNTAYGLYGLTVDAAGSLYTTTYAASVQKLAFGLAPSVIYATPTVAGSTDTTDGAQSFQIENDGNATLTGTAPGPASLTTGNFTQVAGNGTPVDCAASFTLAQGTSCNVSLSFAPLSSAAAGAVSDTFTVVSNSLNASLMQTGTLSGTVTLATPQVQFVSPSEGPLVGGTTVYITGIRLTDVTSVTFGGVAATNLQIINDDAAQAVAPAHAAGIVDVVLTNNVGSSTINVADEFTYSASAISWNPASQILYYGNPLGTGILNATDAAAGTITYTAEPLPGSTSSNVTATSVLQPGEYLLTASFTPTGSTVPTSSTYAAVEVLINDVFIASTAGVTHLDNGGNVVNSAVAGGGKGAAVDATGNVWSIDAGGASISKFTSQGTLVASYSGLSGATALAIDGNSNIWVTNSNNTVTELSNNGTVIYTVTDSSLTAPTSIALDKSGNVWIANGSGNSVSEVIGGGIPVAPLARAVTPNSTGPGTKP